MSNTVKRFFSLLLAVLLITLQAGSNIVHADEYESIGNEEMQEITNEKTVSSSDAETVSQSDINILQDMGETEPSDQTGKSVIEEPMEYIPQTYLSGTGEISRLEWWQMLIDAFHMTVEEDNYPDNYFSDINTSVSYYRDIMVATEFGLVDVEAGYAVKAQEPATRELAAHTLAYCIGYTNDKETYSFSDAEQTSYPDDAQVAVDQGWFALSDGKFLPGEAITNEDFAALKTIAENAYAAVQIDEDHENVYSIKSDVKFLGSMNTELTDDDELTIYGFTNMNLSAGDKFAILYGEIPFAYRAESVAVSGENTVVKISHLDVNDVFEELDIQTTGDVDLKGIQMESETSDVTYSYIVGGTPEKNFEDGVEYTKLEDVEGKEVSAFKATKELTFKSTGTLKYDFGGKNTLKASITVSNLQFSYEGSIREKTAMIDLTGTIKTTFSANFNIDTLSSWQMEALVKDLTIKVPFAGVGVFKTGPEFKFNGSASQTMEYEFSVGIHYEDGKARLVKGFQKKSFTVSCKAEITIGFKTSIGFDTLIVEGNIYVEVGAKGTIENVTHINHSNCQNISAYLYGNVGASLKVKLKEIYEKEFKLEYQFWNKNNSPARIVFHVEDGQFMDHCTRTDWEEDDAADASGKSVNANVRYGQYYTPVGSRYGYGLNSGTGADGNTYTIFEYSLNDQNQATITKYNGNVAALDIPSEIDGYEVVGIGSSVFSGHKELVMVTIPDSVTSIGNQAFWKCSSLKEVTLSKKLTSLGSQAFYECDDLERIEIPKSIEKGTDCFENCDNLKTVLLEDGITEIPSGIFRRLYGLEEINIPETVTLIGAQAFMYCKNIETIKMPDSVTEVGDEAFSYCDNLKEVILSKRLKHLGGSAFRDCDKITSIEIPKSLESADGGWGEDGMGAFNWCDGLKTIIFEEGTTTVAKYLFTHCTGLEEIVIPDTVTTIGFLAFHDCSQLKEVKLSKNLTTIEGGAGWGAFSKCKLLEEIIIPDSVTEVGDYAFAYCDNLKSVTLSKHLIHLGGSAFRDCDKITYIEIPKSLESADGGWGETGMGAFCDCDGLKKVTFEEGTIRVAKYLFANCPGIEEISVPDTVTVIEFLAFYNCQNLKTVNLSKKLTTIEGGSGWGAFSKCKALEKIEIPDSVTEIGSYAFSSCTSLKEFRIPKNIQNLNQGVFSGCSALEEMKLNTKLQVISDQAFLECYSLKEINFPTELFRIGNSSFKDCASLTEITIPENVTYISNNAFQNCDALTKVTVAAGVPCQIYSYAFQGCDALKTVKLSSSVTSLGSYCFDGCTALTDVELGMGITAIPQNCFSNCSALEELVLSYYVTTVGKNAFLNDVKFKALTVPRVTSSIDSAAFSYPLTIYGVPGTYAETYCSSNSLATFAGKEVNVESVRFESSEIQVTAGQTLKLPVIIEPAGCTDMVAWKSSDTSIATVTDGTLKGVKAGTAKITVTVTDDSGKGAKATCNVTVMQPVTSISLNRSSVSLDGGETIQLTASPYPSNANNKEVLWTSSDETIATVSEEGLVTGLKKGSCTITATAADGSGVNRSCSVTVKNNLIVANAPSEVQSAHPYPVNSSDIWKYTVPGAGRIEIIFSEDTVLEEESDDYILIKDKDGKQIGKYIEEQLKGKTISVAGDTAYIQLVADGFQSGDYGFSVVTIQEKTVSEDYLLGDVNNDGKVNRTDRTYLARYLANWEGYELVNEKAADVNRDGKVNRTDRTYLARYLANWNGYSLENE